MAEAAEPILDIRVSDGQIGQAAAPLFLHYDHRDSGLDAPFGHIVENRAIRRALLARLADLPDVTIISPAAWRRGRAPAGHVDGALEDGRQIRARLLIAADGARSAAPAAGIAAAEFDYPQTGIVCTVTHELAHEGVAHEHFLPSGPFAMLPMTDHGDLHRSSIVWTERRELAPAMLALRMTGFRPRSSGASATASAASRAGPALVLSAAPDPCRELCRQRLALIGDAAHAIHPIAGQGLNLGLRDVAAIAEVLIDAYRLGRDLGAADVLEEYQRWRRFDAMLLIAVTDSLNRLFSTDLAPVRLARDVGLAAVNRMPPVKRLLMRHAMGAAGPRPRLLRGLPL